MFRDPVKLPRKTHLKTRFLIVYTDFKFTLKMCILLKIENIDWDLSLSSMISIDNNIQFTYEIENNAWSFFLTYLFSATMKASQYLKKTLLFPFLHTLVLAIHIFGRVLHFYKSRLKYFLDHVSFNSEIQYLKAIALDRGNNPSIVDKSLFKLKIPRLSNPTHSYSNVNIVIPFLFLNSIIL